MKKTIANKVFEKVADNWSFNISKRHLILIVPDGDEWEARELRIPKSGSYMDGTKEVQIENRVKAKTLEEAGEKIFEIIDSSDALKKAQAKYSEKCKIVTIRLNRETETDLVEWFEKNEGQASTIIKKMIRESL